MSVDTLKHIDPAVIRALEELQQPGEPSILLELAEIYIKSSDELSKLLSNDANASAVAHSWKSSSYGIGATNLGQICAELEELALDKNQERVLMIAAALKEYANVKNELEDIIEGRNK